MAVTAVPYTKFLRKLLDQTDAIDFDAGGTTLKLLLTTSSYTPDRDAHDFLDDVTNEVASGGGYTTGGKTLTTVTVGLDSTGHFAYVDADDVVWTTATFTTRRGVLYKYTGVAATSPLVGYLDFGADQSPAAEDFTITWAAPASGGVLRIG